MAYGLKSLWNSSSSILYTSEDGQALRESGSCEANVHFILKWATEVYTDWAVWIKSILPNSIISK